MTIREAELFCPTCHGYVHVLLERCPACGAARHSRLGEVAADPALGLVTLAEDGDLRRAATRLLDLYALTAPRLNLPRKTGFEGQPEPDLEVPEAARLLAGLLVLRGYGCPPKPGAPVDVRLAITNEDLEIRDSRDKSVRVRVPLAGILAIAVPSRGTRGMPGWVGIHFEGTTAMRAPAIPVGSLLLTFAADRTVRQVSVENRPGMFSTKARSDYYAALNRWIGLTSAQAAERRWTTVGLRRYLSETGLGPAVSEPPPAQPATGDTARPSTRAALEELEELRAAALVAEDEYQRKRQEILDRL